MTNAQIARELGTSEYTVRLHVSAILNRLQLANRTEAALVAAKAFPDSSRRGSQKVRLVSA